MKKTILCLIAPKDRGKTSTIRRVEEILLSYGAKLINELFENNYDFCKEYMFRNHTIGILSLGDPRTPQSNFLQILANDNCEIIICASRFKGATCAAVTKIESKYDERYWISPLYEYDSVHPLFADMHELNAKFIIKAILFAFNKI